MSLIYKTCGQENIDRSAYCWRCGASLESAQQLQQAQPPVPASQPSPRPGTAPAGSNSGRTLTILGGAAFIVGALSPWVSVSHVFGTLSKTGIEGDGILTGTIGLILLVVGLVRKGKPGSPYLVAGCILAVAAGAVLILDLSHGASAMRALRDVELVIQAKWGLGIYVSMAGAVLAFIGGLLRVPQV